MNMQGTISKDRVQQYGEVFTPDSIVNDMLDLADAEIKKLDSVEDIKAYIDTTYLEPSCGNGNFLIRILDRKLEAVQMLDESEQEIWLLHALTSIYGVDIQFDNIQNSKDRMLELIETSTLNVLDLDYRETAKWHFKPITLSKQLLKIVRSILDTNIQHGNCLKGNKCDRLGETQDSMIFIEYIWDGNKVRCVGHKLEDIINNDDTNRLDEIGFIDYTMLGETNLNYTDILDGYDF